jgi:GDP-4-dehydro-6-deoxy-D-mannose reductase
MKVLITGASGMIGTPLAEFAQKAGCEVAGLSRVTAGSRFAMAKPYKHYLGDIQDMAFLRKVWKEYRPDLVFHLAAQPCNIISWDAEDTSYLMNVMGAKNVFHACRELTPKARLLPACSSSEYGMVPPEKNPIREDMPLKPVSPYGVSKATMEMMAYQFFSNYGMDVVLPRLFNQVGINHTTGTAIQNFACQLAKVKLELEEPVLKVGNLNSRRDYSDVRDGVKGLWQVAMKGVAGESYNVCSGLTWTMAEALEILIEISGLKVTVEVEPSLLRASDEPLQRGDNSKLVALGWSPQIPFRKTLTDVYENWLDRLRFTKGQR